MLISKRTSCYKRWTPSRPSLSLEIVFSIAQKVKNMKSFAVPVFLVLVVVFYPGLSKILSSTLLVEILQL